MNQATPNKLKPALIGGIAAGVAGSVPVLNLANCACGLLIVVKWSNEFEQPECLLISSP